MNLTQEQARAVASSAAHKRIIAVAGSGKTRVLVEQVGAWVRAGVDPTTMAVVTFTRRAAEELRQRINTHVLADLGRPCRLGYCGTVHGMCYLALALACDGKYRLTPLTDEEVKAVVAYVAEQCHLTSTVCPKVVKVARDETVDLTTLTGAQQALAVQVLRYLHAARLVPVGRLVTQFNELATMHPELRAWFQLRTRTILWDEFQDTTPAQAAVLDLAAPDRSLVVGDPAQAIYGFAGADPSALRERVAESHVLSYNFRSATTIVDVANRQLGHPALRAWREDVGEVFTYGLDDPNPIGDFALRSVGAALDSMGRPATVLCRTNREVAAVRDYLAATSPTWTVAVASPAFDRYAEEPWPALYLLCRSLIEPACEWLTAASQRAGLDRGSLWDVEPARTTVDRVVAALPLNLLFAHDPLDEHLDLSLLDFIAWYQRRDLDDLMPTTPADVLLMTAHAAKGLEWDHVVLAGVGYSLGRTGTKNDQEEANLLYVALTRARERLGLVGEPGKIEQLLGGSA